MLKAAKKKYYTDTIIENKNKPRVMWKFIKQLLPGKSKNAPHGIMIADKLVTDNKQIAQCFNEFVLQTLDANLLKKFPFKNFMMNISHKIYSNHSNFQISPLSLSLNSFEKSQLTKHLVLTKSLENCLNIASLKFHVH